jgi:hypothetical protein
VWTTAQAGEELQKMLVPFADAYREEAAAMDAHDLERLQAACARLIELDDAFVQDLEAGHWAPELQPKVRRLVKWAEADRVGVYDCTQTNEYDFAWAMIAKANDENPYNGAITDLWAALGLPPPD